jgi:regulator of protease activity HflC (stomatin/prohibitin superfamily)
VAQTSLRSIIGQSDINDLLPNRERLNEGLEIMMDSPLLRSSRRQATSSAS